MTLPIEKPRNVPALVALVGGIVAVPTVVFDLWIVAAVGAFLGLFAGIAGVKRASRGARGMGPAIAGIVLGSFMILFLAGMLALFVTRPLRY